MSELNIHTPKKTSQTPQLTFTKAAKKHIDQYLAKHGEGVLTIDITTTGCSGYAYAVSINKQHDTESVTVIDGIAVHVTAKALPLVQGSEIDYQKTGLNSRFVFNNPNVKGECGCGESFTIDE